MLLLALFCSAALAAPDEAVLGRDEGYPVCQRGPDLYTPRCLIGTLSRLDVIYPSHRVPKGDAQPRELKRAAAEPRISYNHNQYAGYLNDYLNRNRTTGLLILKDDTVLVERYQYGRKPEDRLASFSMAKTVTAMLVGIAIAEGRIKSVEDRADQYVPELKGHAYGETPLRHLLTMSSGVRFVEDPHRPADNAILGRASQGQQGPGGVATVLPFNTRERPPGERYNYASAETQVLGLVVRAATGRTLSDYLAEKIWQPMGAEADAFWVVDRGGYETAFSSFNATLRDYARFGLLLAHDGARDGRQIIPRQWVIDATTVSGPHVGFGTVEERFGYGYQTWLVPGKERRFFASGFRGQAIFVDPNTKVVMVHTAARDGRDPGYREQVSLWNAVADQVGRMQP